MRSLNLPTNTSNWVTSAGSGTIKPAFSSDSGAYWCEDGDGLRSNAVNITITAGIVILESPVLPLLEGETVTLHCKKNKDQSVPIADFYKDGIRMKTSYGGDMTIHNAAKSDEGLYRCNISGAGESPESWLTVRGPPEEIHPSSHPPPSHPSNFPMLLWIVVPVLLVALLLLVFGVLRCRKHKGEGSTTRVTGREDLADPNDVTYATVETRNKEGSKPYLPEERVIYSSINFTVGNDGNDSHRECRAT
ncbi:low affinity immunoglobulin gamma Fc region receptor II-a-like [Centropristis striata]|uniref:low affinity immunoglobulin gamma Fc region receptor II-a-like n=1 Tax=Centropristis striata TaxID=184440 RepID=UPI0027DFC079|nr:low affinity immunoglobulin gamma Fc region receptor II-a-like [Centropristis striata]